VANGLGKLANSNKSALWTALSRSLNAEFTCDNREPFWTTTCKQYLLLAWSILILLSFPLCAQDLPAGTTLEARLSTPTGSRMSHAGDQVEGRTIAPIGFRGQILIPQGSRLFGSIESVKRFGLGLRQITARIHFQFHTLRLPNGDTIPIQTELLEVETAKERGRCWRYSAWDSPCSKPVLEFGPFHGSSFVSGADRRGAGLGHKIHGRAMADSCQQRRKECKGSRPTSVISIVISILISL
jgi:hypothetical protein